MKTSAHVIILYSSEADVLPLIEELLLQNVTGKTWIATSDWIKSQRYASSRYAHILEGTIGFVQTPGKMPGFYEFLVKLKPENQWSINNTVSINVNQVNNTLDIFIMVAIDFSNLQMLLLYCKFAFEVIF